MVLWVFILKIDPFIISEKQKNIRQIIQLVLNRKRGKMCNFIEWKNFKIVYRRYASLYFTFVVDSDDNELIALEIIHRYVTILGLFWYLFWIMHPTRPTKNCEKLKIYTFFSSIYRYLFWHSLWIGHCLQFWKSTFYFGWGNNRRRITRHFQSCSFGRSQNGRCYDTKCWKSNFDDSPSIRNNFDSHKSFWILKFNF